MWRFKSAGAHCREPVAQHGQGTGLLTPHSPVRIRPGSLGRVAQPGRRQGTFNPPTTAGSNPAASITEPYLSGRECG